MLANVLSIILLTVLNSFSSSFGTCLQWSKQPCSDTEQGQCVKQEHTELYLKVCVISVLFKAKRRAGGEHGPVGGNNGADVE